MPRKKPEFSKRVLDKKKRANRGEALYYDEVKEKLNLTLTPTAKKLLGELAKKNKLSRSEWIERVIKSDRVLPFEVSNASQYDRVLD